MNLRPLAAASLAALLCASCSKPASTPPPTVTPSEPASKPAEAPDERAKARGALYHTEAAELTDARRAELATLGDLGAVHEDCLGEEECYTEGKCDQTEDDAQCYARAEDCAATAACALVGACTRVEYVNAVTPGGLDACMPGSDADCADSLACAQEGRCVAVSGWDEHTCEARLDAHCAASAACADEGRCKALENTCVTPSEAMEVCADSGPCTEEGIDCEPIDNRCRNPEGFDCSKTTACELHGRCDSVTENSGGVDYVACHVSSAHCAATPECATEGICGVEVTRDHGEGWYKGGCALEGPTGCDDDYTRSFCVKTEEGCAKSSRCASHGGCSAASASAYCRPTEEAHCAQSTNCTQHGFCSLADESSYMVCSN